jgi:hypothetical protein
MTYHAKGAFTVDVRPLTPAPAEGLSRFSIDKQIHGDLDATSEGEMFSGGDPKQGVTGYVAIEVVTGTLKGKHGGFALQHTATMDRSGRKMSVIVVPGSGTGELKEISGTFDIQRQRTAFVRSRIHSSAIRISVRTSESTAIQGGFRRSHSFPTSAAMATRVAIDSAE